MPQEQEFLAVLHVHFKHRSEVDAVMFAEDCREEVGKLLEDDDGGADVTEVILESDDPRPSGDIAALQRARNILIRTRIKEAFDTARVLDQVIHSFKTKLPLEDSMTSYDWGKFMQIAAGVLKGIDPK